MLAALGGNSGIGPPRIQTLVQWLAESEVDIKAVIESTQEHSISAASRLFNGSKRLSEPTNASDQLSCASRQNITRKCHHPFKNVVPARRRKPLSYLPWLSFMYRPGMLPSELDSPEVTVVSLGFYMPPSVF